MNAAAVRKVKRNGRDLVIVPSATLPDDVVMNGIKYPAGEIEASFKTLERTPAPLGHPIINGKFVSPQHQCTRNTVIDRNIVLTSNLPANIGFRKLVDIH